MPVSLEKITPGKSSPRPSRPPLRPSGWCEIAHGHGRGRMPPRKRAGIAKISFFSAAEAADVEAVAAQIIPTDDTPGAREAGVVYFIDRALATFLSQLAGDYRAQLAAFQAAFRERHPAAASFASLTSEQQIEYLKAVDHTPFFDTTRLLTLLGMFSLPAYGGNRDGVGWKLLGFEDAPCLSAAVRLLRSRLSRLRRRPGEQPNEHADVSRFRHRRLRHRRIRRGGRRDCAGAGAGRALGRADGTGTAVLAADASSTMS